MVLAAAPADGDVSRHGPILTMRQRSAQFAVDTSEGTGGTTTARTATIHTLSPALDLSAVTGGDAFLVVETAPPGASVLVGGRQGRRDPVGTSLRHARRQLHGDARPPHPRDCGPGRLRPWRTSRCTEHSSGRWPACYGLGDGDHAAGAGAGWSMEGARLADSTPVTLDGLPSGPQVLTLGAAESPRGAGGGRGAEGRCGRW